MLLLGQCCTQYVYRCGTSSNQGRYRQELANDMKCDEKTIRNYIDAYKNWLDFPLITLAFPNFSYLYNPNCKLLILSILL